jgi:hypothetical protein
MDPVARPWLSVDDLLYHAGARRALGRSRLFLNPITYTQRHLSSPSIGNKSLGRARVRYRVMTFYRFFATRAQAGADVLRRPAEPRGLATRRATIARHSLTPVGGEDWTARPGAKNPCHRIVA